MKDKTKVPAAKAIIKGGKVNDMKIMKKTGEQKSKSKPIMIDAKPKYPKVKSDSYGK
ncbi:MAG TPA: hypothetical protein VNW06_03385 [Cytophagaceae bacterium]|nr:hypothetical protein [Cytophagaceae bacterium]